MSDEDDKKALEPIEPHLRQIAEASTIPEAKEVRAKALALEAYAKEARNAELLDHAVECKLLAERRAGEILREMAAKGERAKSGDAGGPGSERIATLPRLADLGLSKAQSSAWQKLAAMNDEQFAARLNEAKTAAMRAIEMTKEERAAFKRERREEREREQAEAILNLPDERFGVIFADPEWRFEPYSRETGMDRAADNHYATSKLEDIKKRDVASIAAKDCVLFLCATVPMLVEALEVMDAWGFKYVSHFAWLKDKVGTGYWNRNCHELLLIGTRGDVPCPAPGTQWESAFDASTGEHSEKPDEYYQLIEHYFPNLPKIELNAREARKGWSRWGLEAPPMTEDEEADA